MIQNSSSTKSNLDPFERCDKRPTATRHTNFHPLKKVLLDEGKDSLVQHKTESFVLLQFQGTSSQCTTRNDAYTLTDNFKSTVDSAVIIERH